MHIHISISLSLNIYVCMYVCVYIYIYIYILCWVGRTDGRQPLVLCREDQEPGSQAAERSEGSKKGFSCHPRSDSRMSSTSSRPMRQRSHCGGTRGRGAPLPTSDEVSLPDGEGSETWVPQLPLAASWQPAGGGGSVSEELDEERYGRFSKVHVLNALPDPGPSNSCMHIFP